MPNNIKQYSGVLSDQLCRKLIEQFENESSIKPDPQPDYSRRYFLKLNDLHSKNWVRLTDKVYSAIEDLTQGYFERPTGMEEVSLPEWGDDGLIMSRYKPGDSLKLHVDGQNPEPPNNHLRLATLIIYLNTVKDGGETHFPLQKRRIKPEAGKSIIFPPTLDYPHEVLTSKQTRYIIQTWIVDPYFVVNTQS